MKPAILIGILALALLACSPVKHSTKTSATIKPVEKDTSEYEITIIDNDFDHWYLMNYSPAKDRSNEYYKGINPVAASNWNYFYRSGKYRNIIESEIDYRPEIEYGIEVNRKLFWYFKFIEEVYKIMLFY